MASIEQVGPTLGLLKQSPPPQAPGLEAIVENNPLKIPASQTGAGQSGIYTGETAVNKTDGTPYKSVGFYG